MHDFGNESTPAKLLQTKILDVKFVGRDEGFLTISVIAIVTVGLLSYFHECCLGLSGDFRHKIICGTEVYHEEPAFGIISRGCKELLHTMAIPSNVHIHIYMAKIIPTQRLGHISPLILTPPERAVAADAYESLDTTGPYTLLALGTISGGVLIYSLRIIEGKYSILNSTMLQEIRECALHICF